MVLLLVCVSQTKHMSTNEKTDENVLENLLSVNGDTPNYDSNEAKSRSKRGFFWDVFQKMVITKNLIVDVSISQFSYSLRSGA